MKTYLVGYDLNKPRGEDDYEKLRKALREHSGWWWANLDSTFIIKSNYGVTHQTLNAMLDTRHQQLKGKRKPVQKRRRSIIKKLEE